MRYKIKQVHGLKKCAELLQNNDNLEEFLKSFAVYFHNQKPEKILNLKPHYNRQLQFVDLLAACFTNLNFTLGFFRYKITHLWIENALNNLSRDEFYKDNTIRKSEDENGRRTYRVLSFASCLGFKRSTSSFERNVWLAASAKRVARRPSLPPTLPGHHMKML